MKKLITAILIMVSLHGNSQTIGSIDSLINAKISAAIVKDSILVGNGLVKDMFNGKQRISTDGTTATLQAKITALEIRIASMEAWIRKTL